MSDHTTEEQGFDHLGEQYARAPHEIWGELRAECPVAHSERHGSVWMPVTQESIYAISYDTDHFSSRNVAVVSPADGSSPLTAPPITSDPPFHTAARRVLLPFFAPRAVDRMEPITHSIAEELLDGLDGRCEVDIAEEYSRHIPVRVIARMLGLPEDSEDQFTEWTIAVLQEGMNDPVVGRDASREILAYFTEVVADRREVPRDDLISELLDAELDGAPLTERHVVGSCFLLLLAGIDTTWSSISAALWHLATHEDDRRRLVAEPELLDTAIEEFLRAYAPVTMAREVVEDTDVVGCPMHAGDKVLLPFGASNRDPSVWDRPDEVLIDRAQNRHVAFGVGIHRCLGSNLARMELKVALQQWLARFPDFELDPAREAVWVGSQVRGPRSVPVLIGS